MNDLKGANFGSQYVIGNFIILLAIIGNAFYNTGCKKIIGALHAGGDGLLYLSLHGHLSYPLGVVF